MGFSHCTERVCNAHGYGTGRVPASKYVCVVEKKKYIGIVVRTTCGFRIRRASRLWERSWSSGCPQWPTPRRSSDGRIRRPHQALPCERPSRAPRAHQSSRLVVQQPDGRCFVHAGDFSGLWGGLRLPSVVFCMVCGIHFQFNYDATRKYTV